MIGFGGKCIRFVLILFCGLACSTVASANVYRQVETMCERAADIAAAEHGIPVDVLRALTLTETGRTAGGEFKPWPWTLNIAGKGIWLASSTEAIAVIAKHLNEGTRNFDIGCFQINFKWHGHKFASIRDMIDPKTNAQFAARFLRTLYQEHGSWDKAAGAYHSRNPQTAARYLSRFRPILADQKAPALKERTFGNSFPLLHGGSDGASMGSLFPSNASNQRRFIGPDGGRG